MPITWITAWVGTLALIGFPFMSGFYSKDAIIEAVHASTRFGSDVAYWAVLLGVLITSFYSFRLLYLTFHGQPRYTVDVGAGDHPPDGIVQHAPHESPLVVTVPLILLAIPSIVIGYMTIEPVLFGGWLSDAITVCRKTMSWRPSASISTGRGDGDARLQTAPFWLMIAGFVLATFIYLFRPSVADLLQQKMPGCTGCLKTSFTSTSCTRRYLSAGSSTSATAFGKRRMRV